MDIVSHGLWGGIAFGRKNRKSFWLSFVFGILPDLVAFGPYFVLVWLGFLNIPGLPRVPNIPHEPPDPALIPQFVHRIYGVSHSLIVFAAVFLLVWLFLRRPVWEMLAWGLHILFDIPTHTSRFFPTPFLWPLSSFHVSGRSWASPEIFIPNVLTLAALYLWLYLKKSRKRPSP